jgi:rhodanese-related sulfurtransferase
MMQGRTTVPSVLALASARPHDPSYQGDVTAREAWEALASGQPVALVDVRTPEEWHQDSIPDIAAHSTASFCLLSSHLAPAMQPNPAFLQQLQQKLPHRDQPVIFICRSGGRSRMAAIWAQQAGYAMAYNLAGGLLAEGGWRASQLPVTSFREGEAA